MTIRPIDSKRKVNNKIIETKSLTNIRKAQIRIYLECFGCCMIILGVLMVFISIRIRYKHELENELVIHDLRRTNFAQIKLGGMMKRDRGRLRSIKAESGERRSKIIKNCSLAQNKVEVFMISESLELTELGNITENGNSTEHQMVMLIPRIVDNNLEKLDDNLDNPINSESEAVIIDEVEVNEVGGAVGEGEEEEDGGVIDNNWTPDSIRYRESQQAAIAAALSIVLSVSTLVGFRVNEASAYHCCLHHVVQVSSTSLRL